MAFDDSVLFAGPSFHVDLAPLDARHPVHYSRRLLIFRCASTEQRDAQLAALKVGVQALLSQCPLLGGAVTPLPPDEAADGNEDWRTLVPDKGIELITKDLSAELPSLEELEAANFPSAKLPYGPLVPVPEDVDNTKPSAACKIQFSAIHGATILTFAMTHCVADGSGTNELMRVLSDATRLAQQGQTAPTLTSPSLGLDRSLLRNITSPLSFKIEQHPAFTWDLVPQEHNPPHPFQATADEIPVLLRISPAQLAQLKQHATPPDGLRISTHDAMAALMWRSMLLIRSRRSDNARAMPPSTQTSILMPSDARRHLGLPASYMGNAVYQLMANLELGALLSDTGLQQAAAALRRAISAVNPELVACYMAQLREKWVGWQFVHSYATTGLAMGSDWTSGVVYEDDWGKEFGPVLRFRYPGENGLNGVMPKLPDGTAEIAMSVLPQEVDMLKGSECFGKYLDA